MSTGYYDESYPPSILGYSSGATAGIPGSFTPANSIVPKSVSDLQAGYPLTVVANPATPWTTGQYVQTQTVGTPGRATWTGSGWVGGVAPPPEPPEGQSEPPPSEPTFAAIPVTPEETPEPTPEETEET